MSNARLLHQNNDCTYCGVATDRHVRMHWGLLLVFRPDSVPCVLDGIHCCRCSMYSNKISIQFDSDAGHLNAFPSMRLVILYPRPQNLLLTSELTSSHFDVLLSEGFLLGRNFIRIPSSRSRYYAHALESSNFIIPQIDYFLTLVFLLWGMTESTTMSVGLKLARIEFFFSFVLLVNCSLIARWLLYC